MGVGLFVCACQGPPGPAGAPGATGAMGTMGAMGMTGAVGTMGAMGAMGAMGTMGEPGQAGPAGAAGPAGTAGPSGQQGANGTVAARDLINKVVAYRSSILSILCGNGFHGSGTKTTNGLVVTAAHVADGCATSIGFYADGVQMGGGGTPSQPVAGRDLVVISNITWTAEGKAVPGVPAYEGLKPVIGEATVLASYPGVILSDIQFSLGLVTDDDVTESIAVAQVLSGQPQDPVYWSGAFMTDSDGTHGSSGAPMFDDAGRWVAIIVGQFEGDSPVDLRIMIPLRFK